MMQVGDKYRIKSDEVCVTVEQRYISQKGQNMGEEMWKPVSYHPNIKQALTSLLHREINLTNTPNVRAVLDKINEVEKWIKEAIK